MCLTASFCEWLAGHEKASQHNLVLTWKVSLELKPVTDCAEGQEQFKGAASVHHTNFFHLS